jgi:hypothetical protein
MADKTKTTFEKVGTVNAYPANVSGSPERGTLVPKNNVKGGSNPDAGTAVARQGVQESLGHKGAPQMQHVYPNSPESGATQRNVYLVRSSKGSEQFYEKRQYGQVQQ